MGTAYVTTDGSSSFNCDGKDDQVQINQALESSNETIYLKGPNTFNVTGPIYINSNKELTGDSNAIIKLYKYPDGLPTPPVCRAIINAKESSTKNITIHGFTIDGNYDNNRGGVWGNNHYNMIQLFGSSYVKIYDMSFKNGTGDAIRIRQGSKDDYIHENTNIEIYNNTIYEIGHDGLYLFSVSNIDIHDNHITCNDNSGIRLFNSNHVKVYNNFITSNNRGGVGLQIQKRESPVINDIKIYDNTFKNLRTRGIAVTGYHNDSFHYPMTSACGVLINHNIVTGCATTTDSDSYGGIMVQGFNNTIIENNIIDGNNGYGVSHNQYAYPAPGTGYVTIVRNNVITNTKILNSSSKPGYGISNLLQSTHSFVINNNCLRNNAKGDYYNCSSTTDIHSDPLFAGSEDYHPKSKVGRWFNGGWVKDTVHSPLIDAGYPSSDYSKEPAPNGNRINIGLYGNTSQASKSLTGTIPVTYDVNVNSTPSGAIVTIQKI
uniref:Disaggregatase-related domain-containing protein n=1 Tax=viral metagenome TaxID=1070528 RepID=A0A6M3M4U0_9ZZZZ